MEKTREENENEFASERRTWNMDLFSDSKCKRVSSWSGGVNNTAYQEMKASFPAKVAFYKDSSGACRGLVMHNSSFQMEHEHFKNLYVCDAPTSTVAECLSRAIPLARRHETL